MISSKNQIEKAAEKIFQLSNINFDALFLMSDNNLAVVLKYNLDRDIENSLIKLFMDINLNLHIVYNGVVLRDVVILRIIKLNQPLLIDRLHDIFSADKYVYAGKNYLENILDRLRKEGLIIRLENAEYVLTHKGIERVPHGKYKDSSDIERALALAKRRG